MFARVGGCFAICLLSSVAVAQEPGARVLARFALGGSGGWDYPTLDPRSHRLYLARADHVQVVDTTDGKAVAAIADTPGVHGIALAPELGKGFISCGKANVVKVFDLRSNAVIASIAAGENPDAILFDAKTRRVFAFNGRSHDVTVIDAKDHRVLATIALDGVPEFARSDEAGKVFVNIEDKAQLAVIDSAKATLKSYFPLPHCEGPTGLALDVTRRRSFSSCGNKTLTVLDMDSGKAIASLPIGARSDGAEFDGASKTIFSANGEGNLSRIREVDADHYESLPELETQRGARTLALDEPGRRLFLPTAQYAQKSPTDDPRARPQVVPESFVVLVVDIAIQSGRN